MVKVGSLSVRWVLMKHAEPWLLTVNSKQWCQSSLASDPFLEKRHSIPFVRKRCSREIQVEKEEPPVKKLAVSDGENAADEGGAGDVLSNKTSNEEEQQEQQRERAGEVSGDQLVTLEDGGKPMEPEEEKQAEAGEEMMDAQQRQDSRNERRLRSGRKRDENIEEACSSSTGPDADA